MEGIVLDLETQHLMKDVIGLWCYNNQGSIGFLGGNDAHMRLVKMGWPLWPSFDYIIREKGPPQLAPWMKTKVDFPITSVKNAVKAARKCGGDGDVYYSWALHEIDARRRIDNSRSLTARRLGLSVAVTWDEEHQCRVWWENQAKELVEELSRFPYIVGANPINFDFCVLERYVPYTRWHLAIKTIDVLDHARWGLFLVWLQGELDKEGLSATKKNAQRIWSKLVKNERQRKRDPTDRERTPTIWRIQPWEHTDIKVPGTRVSLNALAKATLGASKLGKSQDAPALFKSGKLKELTDYCERDVLLTMALFSFGCKHGAVNIKDLTIPVGWGYLTQQLAVRKRTKGPTKEAKCLEYQMKMMADHQLLPLETLFNGWRSGHARHQE